MVKLHSQKLKKTIISIIVAIMLCNFVMPVVSFAKTDTEGGGEVFAPIMKFIVYVCDRIFQFLQDSFCSIDSIEKEDGTYVYQYAPATIFSGKILAFDINFIDPNKEIRKMADVSEMLVNIRDGDGRINRFYDK